MQDLQTWWWAIFIRSSTGMACSWLVLLHWQQEPVQAAPVLRRWPCCRRWRQRIVGGAACGGRRLFSRQRPRSGTGGRARRDHESQQHQHGYHCGLPHHGGSELRWIFLLEVIRSQLPNHTTWTAVGCYKHQSTWGHPVLIRETEAHPALSMSSLPWKFHGFTLIDLTNSQNQRNAT